MYPLLEMVIFHCHVTLLEGRMIIIHIHIIHIIHTLHMWTYDLDTQTLQTPLRVSTCCWEILKVGRWA